MPDPLLYCQAFVLSVCMSAVLVRLFGRRAPNGPGSLENASFLAFAGGFAAGECLLLRIVWPPANGLDRFLTIVLPVTFAIEFVARLPGLPGRFAWLLRVGLAAVIGRVLLHGSVYLGGLNPAWSPSDAALVLGGSWIVLMILWWGLFRLVERSAGPSVPLSLALAIQAAGVAVMLAGYLKGGAAAIPPAAALAATVLADGMFNRGGGSSRGVLGLGVVTLFSILFIGRFFGGLSTAAALAVLLAPLLGWIAELPGIRRQPALLAGTLRIVCVSLPILVVLGIAFRDFQLRTLPLL